MNKIKMNFQFLNSVKKFSQQNILIAIGSISFFFIPLTSFLYISIKPSKAEIYPTISRKSFIAKAIAKSGPAVVTVETQRTVHTQHFEGLPPGLFLDPEIERFFGFRRPRRTQSRIEKGQGSGFIFSHHQVQFILIRTPFAKNRFGICST